MRGACQFVDVLQTCRCDFRRLPADDEALPGDDAEFTAGEGVAEALAVLESGGRLVDDKVL